MIPPKLAKIATRASLCSPLSKAIINSLQGYFPDDVKIALLSPFHKGTSKNNEIPDFRASVF